MVVSNWLFDLIVFGALLVAALLDFFVPQLAGAATLLAICGATYLGAQELCEGFERRRLWTQESVATAVALSIAIFLYFVWRNDSDLALLVLSLALMMASLMLAIALIGSIGACFRNFSALPLIGLVVTTFGALGLGMLAGLLTLPGRLEIKLILLVIAFAVWKLRENLSPPARLETPPARRVGASEVLEESVATDAAAFNATAPNAAAPVMAPMRAESRLDSVETTPRRLLMPRRGTLLDRFVPVLVLGALLFVALRQSHFNTLWPARPASASPEENALTLKP